jgi:cytochrome o ubiquinol oxidase operon protein cyoD
MTPVRTYFVGFTLSSGLTLAAFVIVSEYAKEALSVSSQYLVITLVALAVLQLLVQAMCFLHLSEEEGPRWRLLSFLFALLIISVLVGGTLWIMKSLSHGQTTYREIYKGGAISPQTQND